MVHLATAGTRCVYYAPSSSVAWHSTSVALACVFSCRPLKDGDIVNVDVTVYLNGFHGDTNATFLVGEPG